jgi:hypothetical protein
VSGLSIPTAEPITVSAGGGGMITIDAPVITSGSATFSAPGGFLLTANAAVVVTGSVPLDFKGDVGSSFTQNNGAVVHAGGPLSIEADALVLSGPAGSLFGPQISLAPAFRMAGATIGVGTASGDLTISATTLDKLTGFANVQIGSGGTAISQVTLGGPLTLRTDTEFTGQSVVLGSTAALTADVGVRKIGFSNGGASGSFLQNSGATADAGSADIGISADSLVLNGAPGSLHGTGKISLAPSTPGGSVGVGAAPGTLSVTPAMIDALQSFAALEIHATDTGALTIGGTITTAIPTLFGGNSVTLAPGASVTSTAAGPSSLIFSAEVPLMGGTTATFTQSAGATVHAGNADLYIAADAITLNGTSSLFGNASITIAGASDQTGFDALPSTHSITVGTASGPGLHLTQPILDALTNFASLRLHAGSIAGLGVVFPVDTHGGVAAPPQSITLGGPVQFSIPTSLDADGKVVLQGGTTISTQGAALTIVAPVQLAGSPGSTVTIDTSASAAAPEAPTGSYAGTAAATPGGELFVYGPIDASPSGPLKLVLDSGTGTISVVGPIGSAYPLDTLKIAGAGSATFFGLTAALVDLTAKTGGAVQFLGDTRIANMINASAPYSVVFAGTGKFGDPIFNNTGGLTLIGNYVVAADLIVTAGTTILGGKITTTGSANLSFGNVILVQPTTIQILGSGTVQLTGSVASLGAYNLFAVDASGVVRTLFRSDFTPTPLENLIQQVVAAPKVQIDSPTSDPLEATASRTLTGLSLDRPASLLGIASATSVVDMGAQTSLAAPTAGLEAQFEPSSLPPSDGANASDQGSGGKGEGGTASASADPGPSSTAGRPQGDSKPPAQSEAKPISPVTAVVPGLVAQLRPTVLRAPTGVPGIAQPYSSDGNIGRW